MSKTNVPKLVRWRDGQIVRCLLLLCALGVLCGEIRAQSTTPNLGLTKPGVGSTGWGNTVNANFDAIDNVFTTVPCFAGGGVPCLWLRGDSDGAKWFVAPGNFDFNVFSDNADTFALDAESLLYQGRTYRKKFAIRETGQVAAKFLLTGCNNASTDKVLFDATTSTFSCGVDQTGGGGTGITTLNSQTGATQTFAAGTSGSDFGISSSGNVHTFNLPDASDTARGLVTAANQTFGGLKSATGWDSLAGAGVVAFAMTGDVDGAKWVASPGGFDFNLYSDNPDPFNLDGGATISYKGRTYRKKFSARANGIVGAIGFVADGNVVWHAGNDGSGSGLDADTVDGLNPGNGSGNIPISNSTTNTNLNADMVDGQHASAFAAAGHGHQQVWRAGIQDPSPAVALMAVALPAPAQCAGTTTVERVTITALTKGSGALTFQLNRYNSAGSLQGTVFSSTQTYSNAGNNRQDFTATTTSASPTDYFQIDVQGVNGQLDVTFVVEGKCAVS